MTASDAVLRILACGSVDDGKSTLIGHLLFLTGNLTEDQLEVLHDESARLGRSGAAPDYSLLLDGLLDERQQGITIDVAHRYLATGGRKYILADAPGHEQYTRNMATAASRCDAAILLLDATTGFLPQTRRHALICALFGIRQLLLVVNKMDLTGWSRERFLEISEHCRQLTDDLRLFGVCPEQPVVVPVSALAGDNLTERSLRTPWYDGPTVLDWLQSVPCADLRRDNGARLPVQYVLHAGQQGADSRQGLPELLRGSGSDVFRGYCGHLSGGPLQQGERVAILPSGVETSVQQIWSGFRLIEKAEPGQEIALTLAGEQDVVRGDCIVPAGNRPEQADRFKVRVVCLDTQALLPARRYRFRSACGTATAEITRIRNRIGLASYQRLAADRLEMNDVGEVELQLSRQLPFDPYDRNSQTGSFVLIDQGSHASVACGMILHPLRRAANIHRHRETVAPAERALLKAQSPCVIWLTGLSGSGKSSIANALERLLVDQGCHTMLLDGDNLRHGLNRDLGFTEPDRIENIRRIGEVAKLMTEAGLIVITAFISPYRSDRDMVRQMFAEGDFFEVHVATPLEVCEQRDPKGLYRLARSGVIPNFTGINSPYEEPLQAELVLAAGASQTADDAMAIVGMLRRCGKLQPATDQAVPVGGV